MCGGPTGRRFFVRDLNSKSGVIIPVPKAFPAKVIICAKHQIDAHALSGVTHILSIEDPEIPKTTPPWFRGVHRQIQFHDTESEEEAKLLDLVAPTAAQIKEILNFGMEFSANAAAGSSVLLVHCAAGACRSPAATYAILAQHFGAGHAREALNYVMRIRPEAFPNRRMVKFADELLGFNGEMLEALAPLRYQFNKMVDESIVNFRFKSERNIRK